MAIASLGSIVNPVDWAAYLSTNPPYTRSVITVTSAVMLPAVANTNYVVLIGAAGAPTMPTAVGNTNRYTLKNTDTVSHTVLTSSSQTVDGSASIVLTPLTSIDLISDNTNWWVI